MDRVARRGPLARAPGALKRGHFRNVNIFVAIEGGTLRRKNKFSKKILQCRKTERGTLWDFKNPICCKISKKLKGDPLERKKFSEKNLTVPKKTVRGDPSGFCNIHSDAKQQKNAGGPFGEKIFFSKQSLAVPIKMKGGSLWSRPVWYVTRKNRKNFFGSVR